MTAHARPAARAAALALAVALGGLSARAGAEDEAAQPRLGLDALAYSLELTPQATRAVHAALLPLEVYRGVQSAELADLRVFDAAGKEVPHALRVLDTEREIDLGAQPLPLFPIFPDPTRPGSADAIETLALRVQRDASGTVIAIQPGTGGASAGTGGAAGKATPAAAPLPSAYVLDTSRLAHPIAALRLTFEQPVQDHVLPVVVEASDDLGGFQVVASGQPLVLLHQGDQVIAQNRIELPSVSARYLRLRWPGHALAQPLAGAVAEHGVRREAAERPLTRVRGSRRTTDASIYDFDLGGPLPVDGLRVVLPEDNTVADVELHSYAKRGDAPSFIERATAWRVLHQGTRLERPLADVQARADRYYRLRVHGKGGGLGSGQPELELRYRPHQLLFVARGQPPYQLAYGHHGAKPSRFEPSELLALLPQADRASLPASDCMLGTQRTRAGSAALTPPPPPVPYKRYALWGVLIAAAAGLVVAALRLGRGLS